MADEWFRAEIVEESIARITEPHVNGWIRGNAWLVRGSQRDLLVDCGLGVASIREFIRGQAGIEPVVVLTHAHLDHMGSAHEFAACWGHRGEPFERPPPGSLTGPKLQEELGLVEALPAHLVSAVPYPGYDPTTYRLQPARITRWLSEGDRIDLGDRLLTVLHLPGHTPGSIALLDEIDGVLFSGDVVYDGPLLDDTVGADRVAYRASMARLCGIDVRVVYSGHGPGFGGGRLRALAEAYLAETGK